MVTTSQAITFPQAAQLLSVSRQTVYEMVRRGDLTRIITVGEHRFLDRDEVTRLAKQREEDGDVK